MNDGLDVTWEWARAEYDQMAIFDRDEPAPDPVDLDDVRDILEQLQVDVRSWDTTVWSTSTA